MSALLTANSHKIAANKTSPIKSVTYERGMAFAISDFVMQPFPLINRQKMILKKLGVLLALCGMMASANATNFSFTGDFQYDNEVQLFTFVVGTTSEVSLRSWSYAGGVNAAGQTIARGGFDPILALFDSLGNKIGEQDDAGCTLVVGDSVTGACYDTFFTTTLAAGTYTASVQQFDNFANASLADGFTYDGAQFQNFRDGFVDATKDTRNGLWAFDVLNVSAAALPPSNDVPEPASLGLLGLGMLCVAAVRRRKAA